MKHNSNEFAKTNCTSYMLMINLLEIVDHYEIIELDKFVYNTSYSQWAIHSLKIKLLSVNRKYKLVKYCHDDYSSSILV